MNKYLLLKCYYAQFSLLKLGCNFYIFQKIAIYNDELQINGNVICQNKRIKTVII